VSCKARQTISESTAKTQSHRERREKERQKCKIRKEIALILPNSQKISGTSSAIVVKIVKMSDEEARISVYAPADDMQKIKDATFQPAIDLLNKEGMDVQVFVYDINATPPPA